MQKYTNKGSVPWYPKESRTPCKDAVNDSTIASSISWWQGWHLFHCISPMSLQDGKKIFTDKQQLATGFACSSRTVSPDEHCYRLICASCTQFHVPLGTQAFQLPQAASKQRSVPWCCRCGMFAAFTTAAIRLLRSIFIWAPPRTRPKFQHLCAHTRDSQRSRCSARRCNISRLPLSSKHVLWLLIVFLIYFRWWWRRFHRDFYTETLTKRGTTGWPQLQTKVRKHSCNGNAKKSQKCTRPGSVPWSTHNPMQGIRSLRYKISSVPWCRGWPQLQTKVRKHSRNGNA